MTASEGKVSVSSVKERLQEVLEEVDKYKTLCLQSEKELELEKIKKQEAESQVITLNRKISLMEDDYEQLSAKLHLTNEKLEETLKAADECDKQRRALDHRRIVDEDKLIVLEQMFRETSDAAIESEKRCDEASRKLVAIDSDLERAEAKNEAAEIKVKHLHEDLRSLGSKLKGMQSKLDKTTEHESKFEKTVEDLRNQLKKVETHGSNADKTISNFQRERDELQDELQNTKLAYQSLHEESDSFSRQIRAN